ncbi:MAG: prepilin-type N-terminal cleavage/methylation domain-containing protein [Clostridium sp.]|nr:prepilin-type N-terminal cleavage/methylation domain-containing protein [Clostridium sp.]
MAKYNIKSNGKGGFTLIEVIAALAIMAIMAAVVTPKVTRYIKESKKVKALEEVRQVVLAVNTYNMENSIEIDESKKFSEIKTTLSKSDIIDVNKIKSIDNNTSFIQMEELLNGDMNFNISNEGKIVIDKPNSQ